MNILVFAASQREGSYNRQLAERCLTLLRDSGTTPLWRDYRDFFAPAFDDGFYAQIESLPPPAQQFAAALEQADAVLLATPEYNWSVPGHLKNLLDWISCLRPYPLEGKPVLLLSATPSRRTGMLGLTHLQTILTALGAPVYPQFFALAQAQQAFTPQGGWHDATLERELAALLQGFLKFGAGLTASKGT